MLCDGVVDGGADVVYPKCEFERLGLRASPGLHQRQPLRQDVQRDGVFLSHQCLAVEVKDDEAHRQGRRAIAVSGSGK